MVPIRRANVNTMYKNATQQVLLIRHVKLRHIFKYLRRIARVSMIMSIRRGLSRISLFKRRTRMFHVCVTFLLRSRGVSVTYLYSYGISLSYVRRIKAYVLRTCYVCMAYEVHITVINYQRSTMPQEKSGESRFKTQEGDNSKLPILV